VHLANIDSKVRWSQAIIQDMNRWREGAKKLHHPALPQFVWLGHRVLVAG
jgi:hypothetical protein